MSQNTSLVSIIIPAYNAQKYIEEAIESVINQTYIHWELIVIDDGSTDNTGSLIASFSDSRIIVITQDNQGVSSARNRGLDLAKGKYITFLDADDVLPLESIKNRVRYLEENTHIDLVDGNVSIRNKDMEYEIRKYRPYYIGKLLERLLWLDSRVFLGICYFFKASLVENLRFKSDITHCEDIIFYIKLAYEHNIEYGFITDDIYLYRTGHTSAMSDVDGLERGYLRLLEIVNRLENISLLDKLFLHYKVSSILFLSWLFNSKKPLRAFLSLLYIFKIKNISFR